MTISQILYGQDHIWDIYVLGLKTKVFCRKNNQIHFPIPTHSAKIVLIVWLKTSQMPQNLLAQFACQSSKVWDIIEKKHHLASVVRVPNDKS